MQYGALGDTFYFAFAINAADGEAYSPGFQSVSLYVAALGDAYDDPPVYTATLSDGDSRLLPGAGWPNGAWRVAIEASEANGFDVGDYAVFVSTAVGSVHPTAMIGQFRINETGAIPGTATASPPGQTTGYGTTYDEEGAVEASVVVTCQLLSVDESVTGAIYDSAVRSETSNGSGLIQFTGLFPGATYEFKRRSSSSVLANGYKITIPVSWTDDTYPLPPIIGSP